MGTRFLRSKKKLWNPLKESPPKHDGSWDTCVVHVRDYDTVKRVFEWLNSGKHEFKSVTLDSISEIQQRAVDSIAGKDQMKTQDWGTLLREVSALVRAFRDLTNHPSHPLECVTAIAMTKQSDSGVWTPYVQGQISQRLPYYFDVVGYLFVQQGENGANERKLLVAQHPQYEAGERVGGVLGQVITNPNLDKMMTTIFGEKNN